MSVFPFSKLRTLLDTFGCLFTCDGWRRKICGAVDFTYSGHSQGNPQTEPEVSSCHRHSTHPDQKLFQNGFLHHIDLFIEKPSKLRS